MTSNSNLEILEKLGRIIEWHNKEIYFLKEAAAYLKTMAETVEYCSKLKSSSVTPIVWVKNKK